MSDKLKKINIVCAVCKQEYTLNVSEEGYNNWRSGTVIQEALPEVSVDDRELLISQTCGTCWDKLFNY